MLRQFGITLGCLYFAAVLVVGLVDGWNYLQGRKTDHDQTTLSPSDEPALAKKPFHEFGPCDACKAKLDAARERGLIAPTKLLYPVCYANTHAAGFLDIPDHAAAARVR
jgi:hypothetical protein